MSANLHPVSAPSHALAKIFNHLNKLDKLETDVIDLLPALTDDEVVETRAYSKLLGKTAFKIELACDAEIWNRTKANCGRGNVDVEEVGILAAVKKRASEIGCGESTIRKNAQLYNQFKKVLSTEHNLDEKGFYQAAIASPDPDGFIELMAQKKAEYPTYSVAEAWREVKKAQGKLIERRNEMAYEVNNELRLKLRAHFDETRLMLEQRQAGASALDPELAQKFYASWIQEIADQADVWNELDMQDAAVATWHKGNTREDHMATALGLPGYEMRRIMKNLERDGVFEKVRQRGSDVGRGPGQQLWHLIGQPIPRYND